MIGASRLASAAMQGDARSSTPIRNTRLDQLAHRNISRYPESHRLIAVAVYFGIGGDTTARKQLCRCLRELALQTLAALCLRSSTLAL